MRPHITLRHAARCCRAAIELPHSSRQLVPLFSALSIQTRSASILADLRDNPGAHQKRIRVGRGPSSGYGKTSGRGQKGQRAHGKVKPWFQGGQTSLLGVWGRKRLPSSCKQEMSIVRLDRIQERIDAGRIDPSKPITPKELLDANLVGTLRDGIKIIGSGKEADIRTPIELVVSRASSGVIQSIEQAGGKITTRYFTKQSIKALWKGQSICTTTPLPLGLEHVEETLGNARAAPFRYRLPDPIRREDIEYYRDPAHRGYLSHTLLPGESPSLYFKVPPVKKLISVESMKKAKIVKAARVEDMPLFKL